MAMEDLGPRSNLFALTSVLSAMEGVVGECWKRLVGAQVLREDNKLYLLCFKGTVERACFWTNIYQSPDQCSGVKHVILSIIDRWS
jgi:hypothetical protein